MDTMKTSAIDASECVSMLDKRKEQIEQIVSLKLLQKPSEL